MLLQLILGGFAAVAVGVKLYWGRLMRLLRIRKPEVEPEAQPANPAPAASTPTAVSSPNPAERALGESRSR